MMDSGRNRGATASEKQGSSERKAGFQRDKDSPVVSELIR